MNRIDQKFRENKKLLSIYFSAGFPNIEDTVPILKKLQTAGVDMVEIGLPFSDPLADGPTIQASSTQAIRNGMTTKKLFSQKKNHSNQNHVFYNIYESHRMFFDLHSPNPFSRRPRHRRRHYPPVLKP